MESGNERHEEGKLKDLIIAKHMAVKLDIDSLIGVDPEHIPIPEVKKFPLVYKPIVQPTIGKSMSLKEEKKELIPFSDWKKNWKSLNK